MPALAAAIPSTIEAVTVYADDDDTGQDSARKLAEVLASRVEVSIVGLKGVNSGVEGHYP
jgi:hypothetical protein